MTSWAFSYVQMTVGELWCLRKAFLSFIIIVCLKQFNTLNAQSHLEVPGSILYSSYEAFKTKNFAEVKALLAPYGFDLALKRSIPIEPNGAVDSLVFHRDQSNLTFNMVDLGYLRNVQAYYTIKTQSPDESTSRFKSILLDKGLVLKNDVCTLTPCAEFQSFGEYWIVDKRWREWTYTRWESLYHHTIAKLGNYFIVNFSETVPEQWVTRDKVPPNKLGVWEEEFKVVASYGEVIQIDKNGKTLDLHQAMSVAKGAILNGTSIKTSNDAHVTLVSNHGRIIELNGNDKFDAGKLDLTGKEESYDKITELVNYVMKATDRGESLVTTSVYRDLSSNELAILLPEKSFIRDGKATLIIRDTGSNNGYTLIVENILNQEVARLDVWGSQVELDLGKYINDESVIFLKVISRDNNKTSKRYLVQKLNEAARNEVQARTDSLIKHLDTNSSIGQMILAAHFEQIGLYINAQNSYKKAMVLSPNVPYYATVFKTYLHRIVNQ